jgi:mRNA-degrading endonuclease toxin of MazEF toxin-antitoxin module
MAEQVRVLAKTRLGRHLGTLSPRSLASVDRALLIALDLPVPT